MNSVKKYRVIYVCALNIKPYEGKSGAGLDFNGKGWVHGH